MKKHGPGKRRVWVKLQLGADAHTGQSPTAQEATASVDDSEVLPTMLRPLRQTV